MALPTTSGDSWFEGIGAPGRLFGAGETDYELFEQDGAYVLSVELPGFDPAEITVSWDEGMLNVAAEHEHEHRGRRTYHQRFRFPKVVVDEEIEAEYRNGILEVQLPIQREVTMSGREIEVQS